MADNPAVERYSLFGDHTPPDPSDDQSSSRSMDTLTWNNVTLTAMLVAILAAAQGTTVVARGWTVPLRRAFGLVCLNVVVVNVAMTLAMSTQVRTWHVLHLLASLATAPVAHIFFSELLGTVGQRKSQLRPLMLPMSAALALLVFFTYEPPLMPGAVGPGAGILEPLPLPWSPLLERPPFNQPPFSQPPLSNLIEYLLQLPARPASFAMPLFVGIFLFLTYTSILQDILERRKQTGSRLEKNRLTLLAASGVLTVLASFYQSSRPYLQLEPLVIPVGGLAQLLFIYLLSQIIELYRLLDLHEIFSRSLIFLSEVLIIGAVYSLLVGLFGDSRNAVNLAITIFLASGVVSAFQAPLRQLIGRWIQGLLTHRRYRLMVHLNELEQELPRIVTVEGLLDAATRRLQDVPRITHAAFFLWNERSRDYRCARRFGPEGPGLPAVIARTNPLVEELIRRRRAFGVEDLARETLPGGARREVSSRTGATLLDTLSALDAELVVPFNGEREPWGFLLLKDDALHEGFTHDELELLDAFARQASVLIQKSSDIQQLKERDRLAALGQMAAGLAHEIRNPLGAIRGAAQYLHEEGPATPQREFLEIIVQEADRLNHVVAEFLDYSRPLVLRLEPCEINRLIGHVLKVLSTQGIPSSIQLETHLDELPECRIDPDKLKQVLLNLLQNAVQAMPEGGILALSTRRIPRLNFDATATGDATRDWIELKIADTGAGIPEEARDKLFIPFFTTKSGGTGLGLAICARLVQAHEGHIDVSSRAGEGTCFTIRLPSEPLNPMLTGRESAVSSTHTPS